MSAPVPSVTRIHTDDGSEQWLVACVVDGEWVNEVITRAPSGAFFKRFVGWKPLGTQDFDEAVEAAGGTKCTIQT